MTRADPRSPARTVALLVLLVLLPVACGERSSDSGAAGSSPGPVEKVGNLTFLRNEPEARRSSRDTRKPLLIDFYADWCVNCKLWGKQAVANVRLNQALQRAVLLKVYDTDPVFAKYQKDARFKELTVGLPFFLILNPDGSIRYRSQNYRDVDGMVRALGGS